MKKIRNYLVAAALTGAVLTVPAGAAPFTMAVYQGNAAQVTASCPSNSYEHNLSDLLSGCLHTILPGQTPNLPDCDTSWPGQTPSVPSIPSVPDQSPSLPEGADTLASYESEVVRLVNAARQENGLQPLAASGELSRVARTKSQDMVDNHYFSHTSPTYGTPFQMLTAFGVSYSSAGENIAYGQRTPQEVVDTWMNSPGHRANILNAGYTQIGVGYVANGNYWTQLFIG